MATGLENLKIYTLAGDLEIKVFHLTKNFPGEGKYRSVDQLLRSSASVSNNIAEAYHKRSLKEKVRILGSIVNAEAEETKRNLEVCTVKGFHRDSAIIERYTDLIKMVNGFIRFLRKTNQLTN